MSMIEDHWISVEDALPKRECRCIVTYQTDSGWRNVFVCDYDPNDGGWRNLVDGTRIIAWMRAPRHYEGLK